MNATDVCDVSEWVLTEDRLFHVSLANIEPTAWTLAPTFCHQRLWVFRQDRPPVPAQAPQVCQGCAVELVAMGEVLPGWMLHESKVDA